MIASVEPDMMAQTAPRVEPAQILALVRGWLTRFVSIGKHEATVISLWVMMTYAIEAFDCVPYLSITSAEKGCGKTRLLEVLELVVFRPWMTGRTTPAVLARKIAHEQPTLLLDESDAAFGSDSEYAQTLRGVLNTGYLRSGKVSLCVTRGRSIEYVDLSTFCPKAIAGIGSLPDTIANRSIPVRLQRKLASERIERFRRRRVEPESSVLRVTLERWAFDFVSAEHPEPGGLDGLPDRAADICEPLLMIAEVCGDESTALAREAVMALCGPQREEESEGVRLLSDIYTVFADLGIDRIASGQLATTLASVEESPWEGRFGRAFDQRALATRLKPFRIKPGTVRFEDGTTAKGYHKHQFRDAWERFLASPEKPAQATQAAQAETFPAASGIELTLIGATRVAQPYETSRAKPHETDNVPDVTLVPVPTDSGDDAVAEVVI